MGESVTVGVLAERLDGVRNDLNELRVLFREDHHRLRSVERAVEMMIDTQKASRAAEARQYRRLANAIQLGSLLMAAGLVALGIITIVIRVG